MINPYADVDWNSIQEINSISHAHCENQNQFNRLYNAGIRHLPLSNYHPSRPWYPLENEYDANHNRLFPDIPEDAITCPNAEHWRAYYFGDTSKVSNNIHMNSIGSTYASDSQESYEIHGDEWGAFCELTDNIRNCMDNLLYSDAGGMTLNHPNWSNWYDDRKALPLNKILRILDIDDRILGIEFYNDTSEKSFGVGWDLDTWDEVLKTGRRAWGFASPDHYHKTSADWEGRNVLLIPSSTTRNNLNYECLKAYRDGRFFAKMKNTDLSFTKIALASNNINIETNRANTIKMIADGNVTTYDGSEININIPNATYARFEATDGVNTIYSNPIIFKNRTNNKSMIRKRHRKVMII